MPDKLFVLIFPHFRIPREHCIAVRPDKGRLLRTLPEKILIKKIQKIKTKVSQKKQKKISFAIKKICEEDAIY